MHRDGGMVHRTGHNSYFKAPMPSSQDKTVQTSSLESDLPPDGKGKGPIGQWNRRNAASQLHQSPYFMVSPPAALGSSSYLRTLLHENKQAVVIHPITRDSYSQSPALHLTSSTSPSLPSSSLPSLSSSSLSTSQPSRYFHVMNKHKQVLPVPPGFNLASLGWVQHESGFGKGEEDSVNKKSSASAYVRELSSNTERTQKKSFNDGPNKDSTELLYSIHYGGACKFPRCEKTFTDHWHFLRHLYSDHHLDNTSTVQCLLQAEVIHSLQERLAVEKQRLLEMQSLMTGKLSTVHASKARERDLPLQPSQHDGVSPGPGLSVPLQKDFSDTVLALRRQIWDGASFSIFENMTTCIEYYKTNNVRPPLTYASLIRWAILESPQKQLALNEIYHWFTKMFAFFRLNKVTWKNAVRHNLSLHKCFVRVQNIKGAVWMVDELEFQRKRGARSCR
ncbi:forkhead box protein P3 isoform X2 [Bufo gargarizans]|uniref:forkhead box protein P3 isoform X2 n=1 Tax=Bufo gargarizans TaxID=30331 RepID=UPI001CF5EDA7|nr:forkhead box protein P3 isoform X2 [Bufo gargarizans]